MASKTTLIFSALLLGLSGGAAFAQQLEQEPTGFYADPVLPDPPRTVAHVYPATEATSDVAAVTPAAGAVAARPQHVTGCSPLNPCAVSTPAARG